MPQNKQVEQRIREIVEKHVLPKVTPHKKGDVKNAELLTKIMAYEMGLDEVVESYVKDFSDLISQVRQEAVKEGEKIAWEKYKQFMAQSGVLIYDGSGNIVRFDPDALSSKTNPQEL